MKQFKTEAKKVLDLMINSIYTNKDIFIRELISNASDAIDKLYYKSLTGGISGLSREDFCIELAIDKDKRLLTISDNGIGMTGVELENNLGVIAKSGSLDFKSDMTQKDEISIIGQFGVGFYSAFMVSDKVEVLSKAYDAEGDAAHKWTSCGADGYDIKDAKKETRGTLITLHIKEDVTDGESFSKYLDEDEIRALVRKYSDYIKYPIKLSGETVNTMKPIWKRPKSQVTQEEYDGFYSGQFHDYEKPLRRMHISAEGNLEYKALLYIPSHAPYGYYTKEYEKGLALYTNGVLITDCNKDLLPDYFGFVKGLVDTELTLNISRETVQQNRRLKQIASFLEKKIKSELEDMLKNDRENYVKFFETLGVQLKYGVYEDYGMNKEALQDLLIFRSLKEDKFITLSEYVGAMKSEQKYIYYACGKTVDGIKALPTTERVLDYGFDVLCMTEEIDEFALRVLRKYNEKEFRNTAGGDLGLVEEAAAEVENASLTDFILNALDGKVSEIRLTTRLKNHPVCLTSVGNVSIEMERILNSMPDAPKGGIKAEKVLEINASHKVYNRALEFLEADKDKLTALSNALYSLAALIEGMPIENPTKLAENVFDLV